MCRGFDLSQYEAAQRRRTRVAALLIFVCIPLTLALAAGLFGNSRYLLLGAIILSYTMIPFFMVFERRKPKAREIVLIAAMAALTVCISMVFYMTIPIKAGSAMVIIAGISLGPEAGFLVGALARFVLNFYQGHGAWTSWQMFCWGLLGFLAGLCFNKVSIANAMHKQQPVEKQKSGDFKVILGPVLCILFALLAAYISYLLFPGEDTTFFGWRLYVFGALGLLLGVALQHKRLPVDSVTLTVFTFFTIFIIYGGIMNICAMVTTAAIPGGAPVSLETLKALYISGASYDAAHAATAALFMFLFGKRMIRRVERVKIKYGIYR